MNSRYWLVIAALPALALGGVQFSKAAFTENTRNSGNDVSANADWTAPRTSASRIVKASGGSAGYIRAGGSYHVYANVTDSGRPATGIALVTADVRSITSAMLAAPLASGSHSADGATYNYRSTTLVAGSSLADGTYQYTVTSADAGGNTGQTAYTVTVDNTAPSASDVQTGNVAGGTAGRAEAGDAVVLTYSEPLDAISILAGWSGASTSGVVRIADGGSSNDVLTVRNAANTSQLPLGSVNLGRSDYVSATRDFGASGTPSQMTHDAGVVTLTLGTPNGTTGTVKTRATMTWTPSSGASDRAGNASSATARTETGGNDFEF